MIKIIKRFTLYVTAFLLISLVCGLVYATVQQVLRQGGNDPQIQVAEQTAAKMKDGGSPSFGEIKTDLAQSLETFLIIYDKDGNPVDGSANLDGQLPKPPKGIFDTAKQKGENRVTWQPKAGVREALVVVPVGDEKAQFIIVGRSLREVEKREYQLLQIVAAAWAIMILVAFGGILAFAPKNV